MNRKYPLKTSYNWRGAVAELLARFHVKAYASRSKSYFKSDWMPERYNEFLSVFWSSIDLFKLNENGILELFEVKTIVDNVKRIPDITRKTNFCYNKAIGLGIKVFVIFVSFHDDWNIFFEIKNFEDVKFRVNNGGWYRRK
ncbi:MAG: hypothetical protein ABIB43_06750 [archaeon]